MARSRVMDHAKYDDEPTFRGKLWTWLEISWLLLSVYTYNSNKIVFITVLYIPLSALFSTLYLYGKYSTLFLFDPPIQNTLCTYIGQ